MNLPEKRPGTAPFSIEDSLRFLAEAGKALAESLDYGATLDRVVRLMVPRLADWCSLHILDRDGSIRRIAVAHSDPGKVRMAREVHERYPVKLDGAHGIPHIIRTGKAELHRDVPESLLEMTAQDPEHLAIIKSLGIRSAMGIPVVARGNILGVMSLVMAESGRRYGEEDLALAQELAERVGLAMDNARLHLETRLQAQALQAQTRTLEAVFSASPDHIYLYDREGRLTHVNEQGAKSLGFPVAEVIGKTLSDLARSPEIIAEIEGQRRKVVETGRSGIHELAVPGPAGGHFEYILSPVYGESGGIDGVVGITRDITLRKRTEDALRRSEAQYRNLTENLPQLVWMNDAEGNPRYFNRRWKEYTGVEIGLERGALNQDFIHPDDLPSILRSKRKSIATASAWEVAVRIRNSAGEYRWHLARIVPLLDDRGSLESWFGTATDIHELRTTQEKLRQSQKLEAIGRLAGGVAHDFNNLLTAINGYSSLLLGQLGKDHPHHLYASEIHQAGERAAALTRQLLAFSRRQILNPKLVDLNEVVLRMSNMVGRLIGEQIRLESVPGEGLAKVLVDPGQMEQVILNLCVNARDAMADGGTLVVRTGNLILAAAEDSFDSVIAPGRYVELEITDTGHGMDEGVISRLFEPFFTTKEMGKGTGLGLSMVQGIVKQSGGFIRVYSAPGAGSSFRVLLPSAEAEAVERPTRKIPLVPGDLKGTETVLLVEDEPSVRGYVRAILEQAGYRVLEAPGGREGLQVGGDYPEEIHLLLSDVVMPGMMGPKLAEQMKRLRPGLRVLFMSGYTDFSGFKDGIREDEAAFLQKPFTPDLLLKKVRDVLAAETA